MAIKRQKLHKVTNWLSMYSAPIKTAIQAFAVVILLMTSTATSANNAVDKSQLLCVDILKDLLKLPAYQYQNQAGRVEKLLKKVGFKSFSEFQRQLHQYKDRFPTVYEMIKNEDVEFAIHAPEKHREAIAKSGFRHSFETGNSYIPREGYSKYRDLIESLYLGLDYQNYQKIHPSWKPKYGILRPNPNSKLKPYHASYYGEDIWILKKEKLSAHTTFTLRDSLNQFGMIRHLLLEKLGAKSPFLKASKWHSRIFIPWQMRDLLIPALELGAPLNGILEVPPIYTRSAKFFLSNIYRFAGAQVQDEFKKLIDQIYDARDLTPPGYSPHSMATTPDYVELEFWLPMDNPSFVQSFIFTKTEPSHEEFHELQSHGILVFDGRKSTSAPELWSPFNR